MKKLICLCLCLCLLPLFGALAGQEIAFVDDDGNDIRLSAPAKKVISLYSAHTETLYFLGAGDLLLGAHDTSVFPPDAAFLPRFDYAGDPEKIIAAEPDLVLIRPFITRKAPDTVAALKKAGIPVVSLYAESLGEFDEYVTKLALLVGKEKEAAERLTVFHASLDAIRQKTATVDKKVGVFFESTENELRTVTEDSMAGMGMTTAGGVNVAVGAEPVSKGSSIAAWGAEKILEKADAIDVYVSQRGAMNAGGNEHSISIRPGFSAIKAVQDKRILLINEKIISSPSFRYPVGVMELARFFYPELMDDLSGLDRNAPCTKRDFADILMKARHLPVFVPSSSKYYKQEHKGHVYGLFKDVPWTDRDFNAIETAVAAGLIGYDGDTFGPDEPVTREMLAKAVFISGDFKASDTPAAIRDLDACAEKRIVQTLVDAGAMALIEDSFQPNRPVSRGDVADALNSILRK